MNNELKPYDEYKKTEYDWLESVPKHWQKLSIRSITKLSSERNGERTDLELLSVYREYGVIKKSSREDNHNVESQDLSNYKFVDKGYLVLNKMKMWQGSLGVSKYKGIVSPAYIVCKLVGDLNFNYVNYLLRSTKFKTIYNRLSYGVRVGQWDMRYDDFKNIKLYIPTIAEQDQIVKYLDFQLLKINKFIKAKKKLIDTLKEQKQAIINGAVTKGINPNVKMKSSGVEWLGDIPEHWEILNLSQIAKVTLSGLDKKSYDNQKKVFLCNYVDVYKNDYITNNIDFMIATASEDEIRNLSLRSGDIIITKDSESWDDIAVPAYVPNKLENVVCAYHLALIRKKSNNIISEFLYSAFLSQYVSVQYKVKAKGVTRYGLSYQSIRDVVIFVPPINEQHEIIKIIKSAIINIDEAISRTQKEIELITEYRTSFISDVVTGKVDVRNIKINEIIDEDTKDYEIEYDEELENDETLDIEEE
ncbi:restriction endonuclease subunit S [Clostridium chromiireducens]|uniref:Restriction endonuclease subunit S n=1 Tax=Clostridium chromiireducens TaxID=225345 RepID=A0A964RSI9_9CLOT|nr:restriction endonuclease subunit S [Clostridium chromiireducens]MVX67005.1 restriction endonuclease subunit S [Clostridium chromiireducens]